MVRRLVEAEYGFPDNDKEREGPWAGMTVSGGKWSYDADNGDVIAALADGSQPEGCVQFAFTQENGMVSFNRNITERSYLIDILLLLNFL